VLPAGSVAPAPSASPPRAPRWSSPTSSGSAAKRRRRPSGNAAARRIVHVADFLDLEEADFDRVLRINLKGAFLLGQAAARQMVRQGPDAKGTAGTIINMSSVNAVMAIPNIAPYVVAKGGMNQLTKVMAMALADKGIRVNGIGPGSIATEMVRKVASDKAARNKLLSRTPLGRFGEPEEVASVALFLASEDSSYLTGQTIYPDGGRLALNYTVPVPD
jgi:NAD(P)-dependent dehydrogenase (short-subunit alcohol dehydrogenase family)